MQRLRTSRVLLIGINAAGAETAKNLALAGVSSLYLYDPTEVSQADVDANIWVSPGHLQRRATRAHAAAGSLRELNPRCQVQVIDPPVGGSPDATVDLQLLSELTPSCVVSCLSFGATSLAELSAFCHVLGIAFVAAHVAGMAAQLFCDFGGSHISLDPLGEHRPAALFSSLSLLPSSDPLLANLAPIDIDNSNASPCLQVVLPLSPSAHHVGVRGDRFQFIDIPPHSPEPWRSLNGCSGTLVSSFDSTSLISSSSSTTTTSSFNLIIHLDNPFPISSSSSSSSQIEQYCGNGALRYLPSPQYFRHREWLEFANISSFDDLPITCCHPMDPTRSHQLHVLFQMYHQRLDPDNVGQNQEVAGLDKELAQRFFATTAVDFPPLNAFIGGFAAQEAIKAVTHKFSPLSQFFYLDYLDLLPPAPHLPLLLPPSPGLGFLGAELQQKIASARVFVVGAGAIGCELLKNLVLMGVGAITVTDDDAIEQSNLNRQFLFRDGDIGKLKSEVAAAKVRHLSPGTLTRIVPLRQRVQPSTEGTFSDQFFCEHTIVLNALDNLAARLYVDSRCVANLVPMIDSGTLGTQGHVQVVVPHRTENYASQSDPDTNIQIPVCTLKSFPHDINHCIEWARDLCFEKQLSIKPTVWNRFFFGDIPPGSTSPRLLPQWDHLDANAVSILSKMISPQHEHLATFAHCVRLGRLKFEKYFHHDPRKLLELFPADHLTSEGERFWAPPRRIPTPTPFSPENPLHLSFVLTFSSLIARAWGIPAPQGFSVSDIPAMLHDCPAPIYPRRGVLTSSTPSVNLLLASPLRSSGDSSPKRDKSATFLEEVRALRRFVEMDSEIAPLQPIEFDKDDTSNLHVGLVAAAANLRATVYGIETQDVLEIKKIAGRILPAIAATTSCVSGLVCAEMVKVLSGRHDSLHNAWLNLAVPSMLLTEPAAPSTFPLGSGKTWTAWDTWHLRERPALTIRQLINLLTGWSGGLVLQSCFEGPRMVYLDFLHEHRLDNQLRDLLAPGTLDRSYVDLDVMFVSENDDDDALPGPTLRFYL